MRSTLSIDIRAFFDQQLHRLVLMPLVGLINISHTECIYSVLRYIVIEFGTVMADIQGFEDRSPSGNSLPVLAAFAKRS